MSAALGGWGVPGFATIRETAENNFLWGITGTGQKPVVYKQGLVLGTSRDAGNTPTTVLRPGLVLAEVADGQYKEYDPASSTAAQRIASAILPVELRAQDFNATDADRYIHVVVGGNLLASKLYGLDNFARAQLGNQFLFDDVLGNGGLLLPFCQNEVAKTSNYPIVAADIGTLFTNAGAGGAVVFTLPTLARGLWFRFRVIAAQNVTIASAGSNDDIVTDGDATADSIAFSTESHQIGGGMLVYANQAGTKWYTVNESAGPGNVVTVA